MAVKYLEVTLLVDDKVVALAASARGRVVANFRDSA